VSVDELLKAKGVFGRCWEHLRVRHPGRQAARWTRGRRCKPRAAEVGRPASFVGTPRQSAEAGALAEDESRDERVRGQHRQRLRRRKCHSSMPNGGGSHVNRGRPACDMTSSTGNGGNGFRRLSLAFLGFGGRLWENRCFRCRPLCVLENLPGRGAALSGTFKYVRDGGTCSTQVGVRPIQHGSLGKRRYFRWVTRQSGYITASRRRRGQRSSSEWPRRYIRLNAAYLKCASARTDSS